MVPFAALLPVIALDVSHVIWGYGAAADDFDRYAPSLAVFGPGLVFFTVHYLVLRGFYALEQTRVVFLVQCVVAAANITMAVTLVALTDDAATSPALVGAYAASYAVGSATSYLVLSRRVGGLAGRRTVRFLVRLLLVTAGATAVGGLAMWGLATLLGDSWPEAALRVVVVTGLGALTFLVASRVFRLTEVTDVITTLTRRFGRASA